METEQLHSLIAKILLGEQAAYQTFMQFTWTNKLSVDNCHYIIEAIQTEIQKPDDQCNPLIYDIFITAKETLKPYHEDNLALLDRGVKLESAKALNIRANYYWGCVGSEQDFDAAHALFLVAAAKGLVNANYNLGLLYLDGHGRAKDYIKARHYFKLCVSVNYPFALVELAQTSLLGLGCERNPDEAIFLLRAAATSGMPTLANHIVEITKNFAREHIDSIEKARIMHALCTIVAELDNKAALVEVGNIYYRDKEYVTARAYYKKAAKFNCAAAYHNLGLTYVVDNPTIEDLQLALGFFEVALSLGNSSVLGEIAKIYKCQEFGRNYRKAIEYLDRGVQENDIYCIQERALFHIESLGGERDLSAAVALYEKGIGLEDRLSMTYLAQLRFEFNVPEVTDDRASELLDQAINLGCDIACAARAFYYKKAENADQAAFYYRKAFSMTAQSEKTRLYFKSFAETGSPIQQYHWFMLQATETLPRQILAVFHKHPRVIVSAIVHDPFISTRRRMSYLQQLPGHKRIYRHIMELGLYNPLRKKFTDCATRLEFDISYKNLDSNNIEIDANIQSPYLTDHQASCLRAYLHMTILFDGLLNNLISAADIPSAFKLLCECHDDILRKNHQPSHNDGIMSADRYMHIYLEQLQLIEAYFKQLRQIVVQHEQVLTSRQINAIKSDRALLSIIESLVKSNKPHKADTLIKEVLAINVKQLWTMIRENQSKLTVAQIKQNKENKWATIIAKFGLYADAAEIISDTNVWLPQSFCFSNS